MIRTVQCLLAALLIVASFDAAAASFGLSPMRVDLSVAAPTAVITVNNSGDKAVTIQGQAFTWTQPQGKDTYEETRAFIISPPIFTLPPGAKQIVRVALRGSAPSKEEQAFRLVFREVPQAEEAAVEGPIFRISLGMNIPMYVAPIGGAAVPRPNFGLETIPNAAPRLRIANDGNSNLRLANLTVMQEDDKLAELDVFVVLAGTMAFVNLPIDRVAPGRALRVQAQSNVGPVDVAVPFPTH
jgi:fimbrial chaperone protein